MLNKRQLTDKYLSWSKLTKKEQTYLTKKLIQDADMYFSRFIRDRDKNKWCITKEANWCKNLIQHCCHRVWRSYYSHRWNEDNCYGGCASCNTYHQEEHKILLTIHQIKKYGQAWVDKQLRIRNKVKPSMDELIKLVKKYSTKQVLKKQKKSL